MLKSKNVVKKLTMILFTLVAVFAVGLTNVNAETTTTDVEDRGALINAMNDTTTDIVRLNKDIDLTSDVDTIFYIEKSKTLDLSGHTITVPDGKVIKFWYYADANIKLINSSNSSSAKIIGNHTGAPTYHLLYGAIIENGAKVNFEIDGVDFEVKNNNYTTIVYTEDEYESLIIKNSNVIGNQYLFWSDTAKNVYLESIKLDNPTTSNTMRRSLSNASNLTINDVIDANSVVEYYSDDGVRTADRTAKLNSIDTYYGPITVKFANGFNVSNATLTGEYGETPETNITIKNIGENDLQIKNVTVSDTSKFEIIGTTQPTVSAGATNTDFKVKAKTGTDVGTYTATITVTDNGGKTYTATVTLVVEKKQLDGLGAGFTSNWTYGETALEPNISGVSSLGADEYKVEYAKTGTDDWSKVKPTTAGDYTIRLTITGSNYKTATASSTFKILPTEKVVKIVANSSDHQYDGNAYTDNGYKIYFDGAEVTDGKLLNGDIIGNVKITGSVTDVVDNATNNNVIDGDAITITNKESYKNIEFENGTIKITPITTPIIVTANNDTKTYDGVTNLTNNGYTYTDEVLLAGDELKATISGKQIYAGTSDNVVTDVKVMRGSKNITDNYKFGTHIKGTLTVKTAPQTVNITENLYVKVGETLTIEKIKELLASDVADYDIKFVSGTAGTFDATTGFTGTTVGKVTMEVVVSASDVNGDGTPEYAEAKKTFYINVVDKENVTISGLTDNQEFTYDGTTKTPWGTGTITVEGNKVDVNELDIFYNGTGSTLYNSKFAPVDAGTYTITYKVKDSNPNYVGSVTYAFTIKKAQLNKPTASTTSFVYDGTSKGYSSFHDTETFEFTGTNTATNVGNYSLTISLKDKDNYEWVGGTTTDVVINWSITQATPDYTIPTGLTSVKGKVLADVALPTGFTWNAPATVLTVGTNTYKATFTPVDTTNYKTITDIDIEVVVKDTFNVITSVDGGNGTITPSKIGAVEGTKVEITFTPNTGYMIDKVLVNTVETTVTGNKIELTVNEEKEVVVSYKKIPFTVTVKDVDGATITPNGAVSVNYGEDKEFTITANSGYKLVKVLVDGTDKTSDMVGNILKLTNITTNINLEVVVEKIVYAVIEGANQKYTISKNEEAKFRINADFRLFDDGKVYVDNELVDPKNYTAESGSTIITLKKDFVDTLSVGEHTLKVLFNDGGEATAIFNVVKVTVPTDNPNTGDNIAFYIISGILSIIGLAVALISYRRKQTN